MGKAEFKDFLAGAAKKQGTHQAFAIKIGMTPGRFSRVLSGQHSLSIESCLKVALLSGEPASRVLRLADKGDIAEMLERLYGSARPAVSPTQRALLDLFERIASTSVRQSLMVLIEEAAKSQPERRKRKRSA